MTAASSELIEDFTASSPHQLLATVGDSDAFHHLACSSGRKGTTTPSSSRLARSNRPDSGSDVTNCLLYLRPAETATFGQLRQNDLV